MSGESFDTYHSPQKNEGLSNMCPLFLCDHWGLKYTISCVYTQNFKVSWESCSTRHSTQNNKGFSNMFPLLLRDYWGLRAFQCIPLSKESNLNLDLFKSQLVRWFTQKYSYSLTANFRDFLENVWAEARRWMCTNMCPCHVVARVWARGTWHVVGYVQISIQGRAAALVY